MVNTDHTNPYADKDGAPMDGKETQFFEWEKERKAKETSKLSKEDQDKVKASEEALAKRMDS
jgi:hypothetical protein